MKNRIHLPVSRFIITAYFALISVCATLQAQVFRNTAPLENRRYGSFINEHIVRGDRHMARGEFEQALIAYDVAIMQNPGFAESYMKRALAKLRLGDAQSAALDQQQALRLNPYVTDLYGYGDPMRKTRVMVFDQDLKDRMHNDGNIFITLQQVDNALRTPEGRRDPLLYKYRGNLRVLIGKYFEAIEDYTQAVRLDPEWAEAYYNRAIAQILAGNRPDACADFERSASMGYTRGEQKAGYFCAF